MTNLLEVAITRVVRESEDVLSLELRPIDGRQLPGFTPGAHVDVHMPGSLCRQYSLANCPSERDVFRIAVKREPCSRGGSAWIHDNARDGLVLRIGQPRNLFALEEEATFYLLVAAGIGITPLLSMALHLLRSSAAFKLHYFVRSLDYAAFKVRLEQADLLPFVQLHTGLSVEQTEQRLLEVMSNPPDDCHAYLCGPPGFLSVANQAASHWPSSRLHQESFSAGDPISPSGRVFQVHLARSGVSVIVSPDTSIAEAILNAGHHLDTSCLQGICGICATTVLDGIPEHHDFFLSDEEKECGDRIMPCVSRCKSESLTLDV